MTVLPNLAGPSDDLESNYIQRPFLVLPPPPGLPFNVQGRPIPDTQQAHIDSVDVDQAIHPANPNLLVYNRWHGTNTKQTNLPDFLSINEISIVE